MSQRSFEQEVFQFVFQTSKLFLPTKNLFCHRK
jgi:hypothetical protein